MQCFVCKEQKWTWEKLKQQGPYKSHNEFSRTKEKGMNEAGGRQNSEKHAVWDI